MSVRAFWSSRFGVALNEPGTWRGVIMILGSFGIVFSPEDAERIITGVLGLIGILNVILKDDVKSPTITRPAIEDVVRETRE